MRCYVRLGSILLLSFLFCTCGGNGPNGPDNSPPQINQLKVMLGTESLNTKVPLEIPTAGVLSLTTTATDPDQDKLTYRWQCPVGTFSSTTSSSVTWTAPGAGVSATIMVVVSDGTLADTAAVDLTIVDAPSLENGRVTPGGGSTEDLYVYEVTFTDPTNNPPRVAEVLVDGTARTMQLSSGTPRDGAAYQYSTTLAAGSHTYTYRFTDSRDTVIMYPKNTYETGPIVAAKTNIVYNTTVIIVDAQDSLSLASVRGSVYTYAYTGRAPDIKKGDILLSTEDGGYLRKVVSKTTSSDQLVLGTEQASLAEAFDTISFDTVLTLSLEGASLNGTSHWGKHAYLAAGVQIRDGVVILDGVTLFHGNVGGSSVNIRIVSGRLDFHPSLDFGYHISPLSQTVHAIATGTLSLELTPEISASAEFSKSDETLIAYLPIPLEWAEIPASIDFSLYAGYDATMAVMGQSTFDISGRTSVSVGGRYQNGEFSTVWEHNANWSAGSPAWDAGGNATASVYLRPEVSLKVFHVAGPYVDVRPYLEFEGDVTMNPVCWEWDINAGLEAKAGLELDVFLYSKSFDVPLYSTEVTLAHDEYCSRPPTVSISAPTNGSTHEAGDLIQFIGSAYDSEDGTLSGTALVWTSDKDGQIATGTSFTKSDLSVNTHLITLTATDSEGLSATDNVTITVTPVTPGDTTRPARINNLLVASVGSDSVTLTWTSPGDDGNTGTASQYDIRYSTALITESNWSSATQVNGEPNPKATGSFETFTVTGLNANTTYYFAIKTADEVPNWSGLSNVASATTANSSTIAWQNWYGGNSIDEARSVALALDGGAFIAGSTQSFGEGFWSDFYVIRIDLNGTLIWQNSFGNTGPDKAFSVQPTSDGGCIVAGWTRPYGPSDMFFVKTDRSGAKRWKQSFGWGFIGNTDEAYSILQTADGNYMVGGWSDAFGSGNIMLFKLDTAGNYVEGWTIGGDSHDEARSLLTTRDGAYLVAGWTKSFGAGGSDVYIAKLTATGTELWSFAYGGPADDKAFSAVETSQGNFIIAGWTESFGAGLRDAYIIAVGQSGTKLWERTFGGASNDEAYSVARTTDGKYSIAGRTYSFGKGSWDAYLVKLDEQGTEILQETFGGNKSDESFSVAASSDGGELLAGNTHSFGQRLFSDVYVVRTNPIVEHVVKHHPNNLILTEAAGFVIPIVSPPTSLPAPPSPQLRVRHRR